MARKKKAAVAIDDGPHPVHINSFAAEGYTTCGRMRVAGVQVAKFLNEVTCRGCRRKWFAAEKADSKQRSEARNRIETRAKACFEIWDRFNGGGRVWEHLSIDEQEAFRQILDYTEALFLEDDDERRDRAWREREKL